VSSRLVRNASPLVAAWAGHRLNTSFREPYLALGVLDSKDRLVGAVIYNDYDACNVEMTAVGPQAFRRHVAREIFSVAFDELKCRRISLTIPAKNTETLKRARKWGWVVEGTKRHYYDDDDAVILGMTRDECRFLRGG
jgi:RimJ/RimL family protein N-acetyltransferase